MWGGKKTLGTGFIILLNHAQQLNRLKQGCKRLRICKVRQTVITIQEKPILVRKTWISSDLSVY